MITITAENNITLTAPDDVEYYDIDNALITIRADKRWWNLEGFDPIAILQSACDAAWDLPAVMSLFFDDPREVGFTMHGLDEGYGDPMFHSIMSDQEKHPYTSEAHQSDPLSAFCQLFINNPEYEAIEKSIRSWDGYDKFST